MRCEENRGSTCSAIVEGQRARRDIAVEADLPTYLAQLLEGAGLYAEETVLRRRRPSSVNTSPGCAARRELARDGSVPVV